jgi:hypothetical protein
MATSATVSHDEIQFCIGVSPCYIISRISGRFNSFSDDGVRGNGTCVPGETLPVTLRTFQWRLPLPADSGVGRARKVGGPHGYAPPPWEAGPPSGACCSRGGFVYGWRSKCISQLPPHFRRPDGKPGYASTRACRRAARRGQFVTVVPNNR